MSNASKHWVLFQETNKGGRYFTGKGHPISTQAWTSDIDKAKRFSWQAVVNMREWVSANTSGESIKIEEDV